MEYDKYRIQFRLRDRYTTVKSQKMPLFYTERFWKYTINSTVTRYRFTSANNYNQWAVTIANLVSFS